MHCIINQKGLKLRLKQFACELNKPFHDENIFLVVYVKSCIYLIYP